MKLDYTGELNIYIVDLNGEKFKLYHTDNDIFMITHIENVDGLYIKEKEISKVELYTPIGKKLIDMYESKINEELNEYI